MSKLEIITLIFVQHTYSNTFFSLSFPFIHTLHLHNPKNMLHYVNVCLLLLIIFVSFNIKQKKKTNKYHNVCVLILFYTSSFFFFNVKASQYSYFSVFESVQKGCCKVSLASFFLFYI